MAFSSFLKHSRLTYLELGNFNLSFFEYVEDIDNVFIVVYNAKIIIKKLINNIFHEYEIYKKYRNKICTF